MVSPRNLWSSRRNAVRRRASFRPSSPELMEERITPAYSIRATEINSLGTVIASSTQTSPGGPGSFAFGVFSLPDFPAVIVSNISAAGTGFYAHSTTVNMYYTGPTGANSDKLLIEVLGDSYTTPGSGSAQITSNAATSTAGLQASSVVMTSGVLSGNVPLSATPGTTLGGQLGTTTGTGSIGPASSVLTPNPATSSVFAIPDPSFTFYQTYTFSGFKTTGLGSLSAGSTVSAV